MKALILAGGRGKRLGKITESTNKCMLLFNGRPVLEYNLERVANIEKISEIVLVVGHRAEDIINHYGNTYNGKKIRYVIQWEQKGLVHAIEQAKSALGDDDFFLLLGDEILIDSRQEEMIKKFVDEKLFGICGVVFQENKKKISRTYTVLTGDDGKVFRLIEKPRVAFTNWQGTGHCIFKNEILTYIDKTPIHPERGEKELPDLIQCCVDDGRLIKTFEVCKKYTNINDETDLAESQKML
jgi:UDP-N-acetylglucosamine diphosphorylase / glucose-1-phosphate thymidylyltransferase / UDP-N-acetylgalactosamine diphosphorylase / glucosamine-1-phosphate N-acetyltransferase / galactosamine-1-phosphate N-acetyltransferase